MQEENALLSPNGKHNTCVTLARADTSPGAKGQAKQESMYEAGV